ncbi:MAG: glycosyltransferase [Planctomycetes bacterium]|nr:glycosyltransferase [Planctomycetota bacterium]
MTVVGHLVDPTLGWEQRLALEQLADRLPREACAQKVVALGSGGADRPPAVAGSQRLPWLPGIPWLCAPPLARWLRREAVDVAHAWGLPAAMAARAAGSRALVVELFDPRLTAHDRKLLRTLCRPGNFAVACSSQTIRRRLIEGGVAPESCVVIRPGVDFALLTRVRRGPLRAGLGLSRNDMVMVTTEPDSRHGGHFEAFWAAELATYSLPSVRIIIPGWGREVERIRRFAATLPRPEVLICPGGRHRMEELIAVADVLVVAPRGDAPTTAIAWAMAAGAAVLGTADYCVAELIANKLNGMLFKPRPDESIAMSLVRLLKQHELFNSLRETARGQAYEVFGLRRFVDQHQRLYQNLLAGAPPDAGIEDSALSA